MDGHATWDFQISDRPPINFFHPAITSLQSRQMSLNTLPYDLLFNIAQYLAIDDIHHLQATCKSLRAFTLTRPVYRALAHGLLARSRPLPLPAFQRLSDLSTQNLIKAVDRAHSFEKAWRIRAPRPARTPFSLSTSGSASSEKPGQWYTKISAPPNEEIDWLSPITSSYTLCATKSGRVICWDVARDICLAEWDPRTLAAQRGSGEHPSKDSPKVDRHKLREDDEDDGDDHDDEVDAEKKWELWKCRVEFDERAVYFTMARVLEGSYDDNRVMEFVLMKLAFPPESRDYRSPVASPLSRPLTFTPDSQCCSLSKSPATSPPPSSQGSSPQDSTPHTSSTSTEGTNPPRSLLLTRATSPTPDCIECLRDGSSWNHVASCISSSHYPAFPGPRYISTTTNTRSSIRAGISFESPPSQSTLEAKPIFSPLTSFHTTGVVMNVFLLDPPRRLLSAFVWVASSNTIGLYVLLDWAKDEYVFVDTGVGCLISSNWSCILHEDQIVIHSEEADAAYQHFYPLNILRTFIKPRKPSLLAARIHNYDPDSTNHDSPPRKLCREHLPVISIRLPPVRSISKKFVFPNPHPSSIPGDSSVFITVSEGIDGTSVDSDGSQSDDGEQPSAGPSTVAPSVEKPEDETTGRETSINDGRSEYETDEEDDTWLQDIVEDESKAEGKGKGKARANDDETVDDNQPGPSSSRSKTKGKMKEVATREEESEEEGQGGSSSSSQNSPGTVHLASGSTSTISSIVVQSHPPIASTPAPNPYPFPPWYPESAHFVRQWWPSLPGVPRLSCTVVLLAAHDPDTHRTRFVLAQHYFRVPIIRDPPASNSTANSSVDGDADDDEMLHLWYVSTPFEVVCVLDGSGDHDDDDEAGDRPRPLVAVDFGHAVWIEYAAEPGGVYGVDASRLVGHVLSDSDDEVDDEDQELFAGMSDDGSVSVTASTSNASGHPSQTTARASGSSVSTSTSTTTTTDPHDGDGTIYDPRRHRVPKCLRFVTFPPVFTALDRKREERGVHVQGDEGGRGRYWREEAVVRTLEIPDELDLDGVETINIDQSQGAVILSVKEGKIFILRYE